MNRLKFNLKTRGMLIRGCLLVLLMGLLGCKKDPEAKREFVDYPETDLKGVLTRNRTFSAEFTYRLADTFRVKAPNRLTIPAGVKIYCEGNGLLVVEPGAKLVIQGTADNPVIFTSMAGAGMRAAGDWHGIVICGQAPVNRHGTTLLTKFKFGGELPSDESGSIQYLRVEFANTGLTLAGVGRSTVVENIQVSYSKSQAFRFIGGNVCAKNLLATWSHGKAFEATAGYTGNVQFGVDVRQPFASIQTPDQVSLSVTNGTDAAEPITRCTFSNCTFWGPVRPNNANFSSLAAAVKLEGLGLLGLFNSVIAGYQTGIALTDFRTITPVLSHEIQIRNNVLVGCPVPYRGRQDLDLARWYAKPAWQNAVYETIPGLIAPYDKNNPLPVAERALPQFQIAGYSSLRLQEPFFDEKPNTIGAAIKTPPNITGWTNFSPQTTVYTPPFKFLKDE